MFICSWNVLNPNESNFGKMCKNCFKVFENFYKKHSKLKEKLSVAASRVAPDLQGVRSLLPAHASKQGNVIGFVSVYICVYKFFLVIERTRDLIYL